MEYVDLGLPSGNLWAKHLLGMNSDTDIENALYFQWGAEIGYHRDEESDFSKENYDYSQTNWTLFGGGMELPTEADFKELLDNTEHEVETIDGIQGMRFTSKSNGNSLFIPFIGYRNGIGVYDVGVSVSLWSSSLYVSYPNCAVELHTNSYGDVYVNDNNRCLGYGVLVIKANNKNNKNSMEKYCDNETENVNVDEIAETAKHNNHKKNSMEKYCDNETENVNVDEIAEMAKYNNLYKVTTVKGFSAIVLATDSNEAIGKFTAFLDSREYGCYKDRNVRFVEVIATGDYYNSRLSESYDTKLPELLIE